MKIRTYLKGLLNTISSPIYYVDVLNAPFGFTVKFFLLSYFLLSILATFFFIRFDLPKYQGIVDKSAAQLIQSFPESLSLEWDGTNLSSTLKQPLQVPYPEGISHSQLPTYLMTISPLSNTMDEVKNQNTDSLLTTAKQSLFAYNSNGTWSELAYVNTPGFEKPFTINKSSIPGIVMQWKELYSESASAVAWIFPVAYFFGMGSVRVFSILMNTIFIFFLLRLVGKALPYKKIIQICLHIAVVAELVNLITSHFINSDQVNMYSLTFWLYLMVILASLWNVKSIIMMRVSEKN